MNTPTSIDLPQVEKQPAASAPASTAGQEPGLRGRIFQNTAANIAGRGLSIVFSAGAAILLARFLGAERLGEYGAIYAYLALFSWLATFGFEPVLVREISQQREHAGNLLRTAMILSTFLSVIAIGAAILTGPLAGYSGKLRELLILAGLEYLLSPLRLPGVIFQVDLRQWYSSTINVVRQGLWFAIIVVLWIEGAPLSYVIASRVLVAGIESWLLWSYARRFLSKQARFLTDRARMIFSHSFPIAFTSLLSMIYLRIDQVMLHKMVSDSVLGQYVAAVKVSELFELLPAAMMMALAPVLAVSVADPECFRAYTDRAFRYFMIVASALCVVMSVGAVLIVRILYGARFAPAAPLLGVLIWAEVPVFFATVVVNALIARKMQNLLPIPTLVGAIANVLLNLVLIPRYAAEGAAWATLISYTVAWMVCLLFFARARDVTLEGLRYALPVMGIALFAWGCAMFVHTFDLIRIVIAMALFALGVWALRLIHKSDLEFAAGAIRQALGKAS